jgi:hypothetical protein
MFHSRFSQRRLFAVKVSKAGCKPGAPLRPLSHGGKALTGGNLNKTTARHVRLRKKTRWLSWKLEI